MNYVILTAVDNEVATGLPSLTTLTSVDGRGFAASGAERLCLSVSDFLPIAARLSLAAESKGQCAGKAEPYRTGCGKAAKWRAVIGNGAGCEPVPL